MGACALKALDGCTWRHWMGVHGGIGWVYMGALDGCTWGGLDGCTWGALDGYT